MYGLSKGDSGKAVELLQKALHSAGFSPGPFDGDYGPKTAAAVLKMRKSQGSGVSDGNTMSAWAVIQLERALAVAANASKYAPKSHSHSEYADKDHTHEGTSNVDISVLPKINDEGTHVGYWQRLLKEAGEELDSDGIYGPDTKNAVANWYHKLSGGQEFHGDYITSWIALHLQRDALVKHVDLGTLKISGTVTAESE